MPLRTTAAAVELILFEYQSAVSLVPFIEVANDLVTEVCVNSDSYTYTTTKLELIERWLSAHFYEIREARAYNVGAGSVRETKESRVDLGFDLTRYGQMAKRIDVAGNLAAMDKRTEIGGKKSVGVIHLGTTDSHGNDNTQDYA